MPNLTVWNREGDEDAEEHEFDEERHDQNLGIQFDAEEVHSRNKEDGGARDDVYFIGGQPLDHLCRIRGEGEGDDDGGHDALAEVGATGNEPQRGVTELARPREPAALLREMDTD